MNQAQYDEAERALRAAPKPLITQFYTQLGAHCAIGEMGSAIGAFKNLTLDPKLVDAHYGLSRFQRVHVQDASDRAGGGSASVEAALAVLRGFVTLERLDSQPGD